MISKTLCYGAKGKKPPTNPAYKVWEYTFRNPIGTAQNGSKLRSMRVVVNPQKEVITAFPF